MLSNTPDNERLTGKNLMIYDYPDGNIDIKYLGKPLEFAAFDLLEVIRQGDIVESKRLREVLKFAMSEQERLENEGHRERRKSDPPKKIRTTKTNANEPSGYKLNKKGNCHIAIWHF
ncbi:hypothetical protein [Aliivibrio fischeri]|uniref:Uncharacterized protein n=1 Tax=Aliivibrio fischeri TaxID=668 RepID=A0A844P5X2_ALIFS|nr:hypothetical protein [Aliivibrio fischeri]MUK51392.1 hypothetical protein [Aliivibrio fischeri]